MFNLMLLILICMHWNACLQYLIAFIEGFKENSWVAKFNITVREIISSFLNRKRLDETFC